MSRKTKILLIGVGMVVLSGLCGGSVFAYLKFFKPQTQDSAAATAQADSEPTIAEESTPEVTPSPAASVDRLPFHSVVQITARVYDNGDIVDGWTGSGTIISPEGLILTNAHVVLPDGRFAIESLLISLTGSPDEVPEPSYFAEVYQADAGLDLAVIKITTDLSGNPVDGEILNLPYVPLGDSDALALGDRLSILGYPGIGGETITLTSGEVSGFTGEKGYGNRAFIKTNATIAGGNSGGMAVNERGELVGIPTQLGYGGDQEVVDCRVLADTNGDGRVDENDTCIPTGGFINSLRPVNLARPLIERADKGEVNIAAESVPEDPQQVGTDGIIYSEDFSDPGSGWDSFTDSEGLAGYKNGKYQIEIRSPNVAYWGVSSNIFEDTQMETMVSVMNATGEGDFGFICRYVDRENFYALEISEDGYAAIWKRQNGEVQNLSDWQFVSAMQGSTHHISASCIGSRLSLSLENKEVITAEDPAFSTGDIGLVAGTNGVAGLVVTFDNLVVREPSQ